jgi:hypothetical protein
LEGVAQGFLRGCAWDPLRAAAGRIRSGLHKLPLTPVLTQARADMRPFPANRIGRNCLNFGG